MYATFEDFLEHQQQQQGSPSDPRRSTPPFPVARGNTPPPPPAPSHSGGGSSASARRKMSSRSKRRRATSGGSCRGSRDDNSGAGGAASDSCTPLVATIRSIQEGRRGGTASSDDVDETFPPDPAPNAQHRNFSSHLSPSVPGMGLHPSSMDALSCSGYAGTNSIDSGYKSACPTPDLSDSFYPESLFLRSSSGGLISPRPRITMGTRMMSKGARVGSDPAYYEDIDPLEIPGLFHRRPSTSPGPRSGSTTVSRPRSASTGSRSSPTTFPATRRALRSSPHMSSTGSLTSSGLPYSRHSSPGGAYSSPGGISPASRRMESPHEGCNLIAEMQASSSSQLALLEREIDALLTGTSNDATQYSLSEGAHDLSPGVGFAHQRHRDHHEHLFRVQEDETASSPQGRPPHPPTRLRGSNINNNKLSIDAICDHHLFDFDLASQFCPEVDKDEDFAHGMPQLSLTLCKLQGKIPGNITNSVLQQPSCNIPVNLISEWRQGVIMHDLNKEQLSKGLKRSSCIHESVKHSRAQLPEVKNGTGITSLDAHRLGCTTPRSLENFMSRISELSPPPFCLKTPLTKENIGKLNNITRGRGNACEDDVRDKDVGDKKEIRRHGKICRKGTPYPHPPCVTVEQAVNGGDVASVIASDKTRVSDNSSSVDDPDCLETATVISSSDRMSASSLSTTKTMQPISRSLEDLPKSSFFSINLDKKEWPLHRRNNVPTLEDLYHHHMYEAILYGEGQVPPCDVPRIPSPPPLPTRPPNLMPPNHVISVPQHMRRLASTEQMLKRLDFGKSLHLSTKNAVKSSNTEQLKNVQHQTFSIECADPNCKEICTYCDCNIQQMSFQAMHLERISQSKVSTGVGAKILNQNRQTKLQKFGAAIRKSLSSDRSLESMKSSSDSIKDGERVFVSNMGIRKEFRDLTIGQVKSGKLDCGCDIDACCSQKPPTECCLSNEICLECTDWKCLRGQEEPNRDQLHSNAVNECDGHDTNARNNINSNGIDTADIPIKAKVTLGIIDPQTVQKKTATKKDSKDLETITEIKLCSSLSSVESFTLPMSAAPPDVKRDSDAETKITERSDGARKLLAAEAFTDRSPNAVQELRDSSSPPPPPPPHAAIFLHDVSLDDKELLTCENKIDKERTHKPQPPPRTTSAFQLSENTNLKISSAKDQEKFPDARNNEVNNRKDTVQRPSSSLWERLNPLKTKPRKDLQRPLPPLPSRAPRSFSMERNVSHQKSNLPLQTKTNFNGNKNIIAFHNHLKVTQFNNNNMTANSPSDILVSSGGVENRNECSVLRTCREINNHLPGNVLQPQESGPQLMLEQNPCCCSCLSHSCCCEELCAKQKFPVKNLAAEQLPELAAIAHDNDASSSEFQEESSELRKEEPTVFTSTKQQMRPIPCPRIFSLSAAKLSQPSVPAPTETNKTSGTSGEPKSGALIQPVDDEYGFNVASYLI
ncbi:uncharacterized protein LOC108681944 isoform X2 [Hyalella azteca]|nr:uncharacterized protein LOC108681944 isoform X2 [Hyalella azteca]